jgi:L-aminopeptidase/D-esterase-like protein
MRSPIVAGVTVGYATLVRDDRVRTGVTAILPRGKGTSDPVFAGWFPLNGNGEMTGTTWIEESGFLALSSSHAPLSVSEPASSFALLSPPDRDSQGDRKTRRR